MAVRSLVVVEAAPWGVPLGPARHISPVIDALSRLGTVDVCVAGDEPDTGPPAELGHVWYVPALRHRSGRRAALAAGMRLAPPDACLFDGDATASAFERAVRGHYDLTWVYSERLEIALRGRLTGSIVLDTPDVPHSALLSRLDAPPRAAYMSRLGRIAARKSVFTWRRYFRRVARRVSAVVVCSDVEQRRLAVPNVFVVPNTYEEPARAPAEADRGSRPWTIGFIGNLDYPPNRDAATWLATEVLAEVHRRSAGVELRLGGRAHRWVDQLSHLDGVHVDGPVDDLPRWLSACDVLMAPIRWGGGTRLKALEAMANRIPLVATEFAVDGLSLTDGVHALIGQSAPELADHVHRLERDQALAGALTEAAFNHYRAHFTPDHARSAVASLVRQLGLGA